MNLGMSENFGDVDLAQLQFPAFMEVDYVRVYQKKGKINIGCDPADFPTASYIEKYVDMMLLFVRWGGGLIFSLCGV